jgi:hypothetical protein
MIDTQVKVFKKSIYLIDLLLTECEKLIRCKLAKHVLTKGQQVSGVTPCWDFIIQSRDKNMHFSSNIPSFSLYM